MAKKDAIVDHLNPSHPMYVSGTDTPGRKPTRAEIDAYVEDVRRSREAASVEPGDVDAPPPAPLSMEPDDARLARLAAHAERVAGMTVEEIAQMHYDCAHVPEVVPEDDLAVVVEQETAEEPVVEPEDILPDEPPPEVDGDEVIADEVEGGETS